MSAVLRGCVSHCKNGGIVVNFWIENFKEFRCLYSFFRVFLETSFEKPLNFVAGLKRVEFNLFVFNFIKEVLLILSLKRYFASD